MFKVTARTILELGKELISSDIIAFYELAKNSFDAESKSGVVIRFNIVLGWQEYQRLKRSLKLEEPSDLVLLRCRESLNVDAGVLYDQALQILDDEQAVANASSILDAINELNNIVVTDKGCGMSLEDLKKNFLVIGTGSRKKDVDAALDNLEKDTPYLGEKGLGRLSAMRLGETLKVKTSRRGEAQFNNLDIDWRDFDSYDQMLETVPVTLREGKRKTDSEFSGTIIEIGVLNSDWTRDRVSKMARNEFASLHDPLSRLKKRNRIVLWWNDERISIAPMDKTLLAHAHAKVSGEYDITEEGPELRYKLEIYDLGFEHPVRIEELKLKKIDLESIVIGKDSGIDPNALEKVGSFSFEAYWYNRRRMKGIDSIGSLKEVKKLHERWSGIRMYRDGLRVFPYGSEQDDWLGLDRKALMSSGFLLNKIQFIGSVSISRLINPYLVDQTNREGLRENSEQQVMLRVVQNVIRDRLKAEMLSVKRQFQQTRVDFESTENTIKALEKRAKSAMGGVRSIAGNEHKDIVNEVRETLFDFVEIVRSARDRIKEVEADAKLMINLAGIGLLVEVVAHELARSTEDALDNLKSLKKKKISREDVETRLESLSAAMTTISKRLRILDPLSVSGRQAKSTFSLSNLILDTFSAHESQFKRHNIKPIIELPDHDVRITAVKGFIVQIIENLISNSVYWLDLKRNSEKILSFEPQIKLALSDDPVMFTYEDNGPGVEPLLSEKIFDLYYSTKEVTRRRGMGLYIARDCARHHGGNLELDPDTKNKSGRLNRFIYTFSED